jgi:hypothetical protein
MIGAPVYQRASLIASSAAFAGRQRGQPGGEALPGLAGQVEVVQQPPRLHGQRGGHGGVAVPDVRHREPGQHVDVLLAVGVPDQGAVAAHDGRRAVEQREADLAGRLAAHLLAEDLLAGRPVRRPFDPLQQLLRAGVQPLPLLDEPVAESSLIHFAPSGLSCSVPCHA